MPTPRQLTSRHERVMHRLMGQKPGAFGSRRTYQIMRRNASKHEVEQANALYKQLGWAERWRMER